MILFIGFQKIDQEGILLTSFYEAIITLLLKPDKDTKEEKTIGNISENYRGKNPQKIASRQNLTAH